MRSSPSRIATLFLLPLATVLLLSMAVPHKFYVSVTNVLYSEKDRAFQITSRVFIDDLEAVLLERYGVDTDLATPGESAQADQYIEKYFRAKFVVELNGRPVEYVFLGKRYDLDVAICYLEIPQINLAEISTMGLQNEVLTDLFEDQKNVVHVKWGGNKKSFVLIKGDNKGMLKL